MGTNFYALPDGEHIGKRSAAGAYCWDCGVTLCPGGNDRIHNSGLERWPSTCPKCGRIEVDDEGIEDSAAGRELGFNTAPPARKQGIHSASSFTWAMPPPALEGVGEIADEYQRTYSRTEFLQVLEECPIQFFDSIGGEFS